MRLFLAGLLEGSLCPSKVLLLTRLLMLAGQLLLAGQKLQKMACYVCTCRLHHGVLCSYLPSGCTAFNSLFEASALRRPDGVYDSPGEVWTV